MTSPADRALLDAIADLATALRQLGAPMMVIGGIAVIARGVPRQTIDIDATVWGAEVELGDLFAVLAEHHILPRIADAEDFAQRRQVLCKSSP